MKNWNLEKTKNEQKNSLIHFSKKSEGLSDMPEQTKKTNTPKKSFLRQKRGRKVVCVHIVLHFMKEYEFGSGRKNLYDSDEYYDYGPTFSKTEIFLKKEYSKQDYVSFLESIDVENFYDFDATVWYSDQSWSERVLKTSGPGLEWKHFSTPNIPVGCE